MNSSFRYLFSLVFIICLFGFQIFYSQGLSEFLDDDGFLIAFGTAIIVFCFFGVLAPNKEESPTCVNDFTVANSPQWRTISIENCNKLLLAIKNRPKNGNRRGCGCLFSICSFVFLALFFGMTGDDDFALFGALDLIALLGLLNMSNWPGFNGWEPTKLFFKESHFSKMLETFSSDTVTLAPQINFDHDENFRDVPTDIKLTYRVKNAPADFVTAQILMSINNVQGKDYPYCYGVFVIKRTKNSKSLAILENSLRKEKPFGFFFETTKDGENMVIVMRLSSGYNTGTRDSTIQECVVHALEKLAE